MPKTSNYTIGINNKNNIEKNIIQNINKNNISEENKEIKGNISN